MNALLMAAAVQAVLGELTYGAKRLTGCALSGMAVMAWSCCTHRCRAEGGCCAGGAGRAHLWR